VKQEAADPDEDGERGKQEGIPGYLTAIATTPIQDEDRADDEGDVREGVQRFRSEAPIGALAVEVDPRPGVHGAILTAGRSQRGLRPPSQ